MVPLLLVSLALVAALLLCNKYYWGPQRRIWKMGNKIPGPKPLPIVGNAQMFWGTSGESFQKIIKLHFNFGPVVRLWLGRRLIVFISEPDDIQQVLGNNKIRNRDVASTNVLIPFFGDGLLANRDEKWRKHRKMITPTLHFKVLETYVEIFGQKAEVLLERLEKVADGRIFNVYEYLTLCTLDAVCETAIGGHIDTQSEGHSDFESVMVHAINLLHNRMLKPWLQVDWLYAWTADGKLAKSVIKKIKSFSDAVISKKLSDYRSGVRRPGIITASGKKVTSFLDMLVEASESQGTLMSPQEIQDEVTTLAAAGYETTANTMAFLLLLIANHPEVQQQLHEELVEVFGDDPRAATGDDLLRLPVMDRVVKETLRMYPSVSLLPREIDEDLELSSGYTLPGGCNAWVMAYVVHRDPKHFPEPEKFWPDRWLEENPSRHPFAYIPFSAGPRNCVGQKYAMMSVKSMLCLILRRFKFYTPYTMKQINDLITLSVTINLPEGFYKMWMERRY